MASTVTGKYLLSFIYAPILYCVGLLVWELLSILGITPVNQVTTRSILVSLFPIVYYASLFFVIKKRAGRYTAYFVGLILTILPPLATMARTGGYQSWFVIPVAILVFMSGALGISAIAATYGLQVISFILILMGISENAHLESAWYVFLIYTVMATTSWLWFRRFYTRQDTNADTISRELHVQQIQSEKVVSKISDGIIILDNKGTIHVCNPKSLEYLGLKSSQIVGKPAIEALGTVTSDRDEDFRKARDALINTLRLGKEHAVDMITLTLPNQPIRQISCTFIPLKNEDDDFGAVMVVLHDITRFVELQQAKDDFLATASHELRTPLTVIASYADVLRKSHDQHPLSAAQQKDIMRITDVTQDLLAMVNDMLDLTRLESGSAPSNRKLIDVDKTLTAVLDDMRPQFDDKQLALSVSLDSTKTHVDEHELRRVMTNLLSNAYKYTERGSVTVTSAIERGAILIKVADTGLGISAENQPKIFEKFIRLHNDSNTESTGTGLGLTIVKHIVENWGGTIGVESDGSSGSCFYFTLPIVTEEPTT